MADSSDAVKQGFPGIDGEENSVVASGQATDGSPIVNDLGHDDLQILEMAPSVAEVCNRILIEGKSTRNIPPCQLPVKSRSSNSIKGTLCVSDA